MATPIWRTRSLSLRGARCVAIDNGVRCNYEVLNKKRGLCSKHYSRWQRTGTTETGQKNMRRQLSAERRGERQRSEGLPDFCLCAHRITIHKAMSGCWSESCRCKKFETTNLQLLNDVLSKMARLGFSNPVNDTAWCTSCAEYITVGSWHDSMVLSRMREHLRLQHLSRRKLRAG